MFVCGLSKRSEAKGMFRIMKKNLIIIGILVSIIILGLIYGIFLKNNNTLNEEEVQEVENINKISIIINDKQYEVKLYENETVQAFMQLLPQEFNMTELNGNEKYVYLSTNLPTNKEKPKTIKKGDIMLYQDNCLVIFYETFETIYSYTKIGHIDNLPDLGNGNIVVKFEG